MSTERENRMTKKTKCRIHIFLAGIIFIEVLLFFCLCKYDGIDIFIQIEDLEHIDDQRATLWPMLVSIIVTMLGSLITTYVFLKEALDRTSDEKPYFGTVIKKYRADCIADLLHYAKEVLILMAIVIGVYCLMYFAGWRLNWFLRCILVALYVYSIAKSYFFLRKCIDLDEGLRKAACQLTEEIYDKLENLEVNQEEFPSMLHNLKKVLRERISEMPEDEDFVREWLQLGAWGKSSAGTRDFINRFSEWEKLLLLLTEQSFATKGQNAYERVNLILQDMKDVPNYEVEKADVYSNRWMGKGNAIDSGNISAAQVILEIDKDYLKISEESFVSIFICLADYRDLLRVQFEISGDTAGTAINGNAGKVMDFFFLFVVYLSVKIFRMLPRIEVFFPGGKFCYANFYNIRFENSAFRASSFENSVFARSHLINTNFGMSKFTNCEFYNMDSRNCSFGNTWFDEGNFRESIFVDADFTGAEFHSCHFDQSSFSDAILSNLVLIAPSFGKGKKDFSNCKIWNVQIEDVRGQEIRNCDFSKSSFHEIRFGMSNLSNISLPENEGKDDILEEYRQYLADTMYPGRFWNDGKASEESTCSWSLSDIKSDVRAFRVREKAFSKGHIIKNHDKRIQIGIKPIWNYIGKAAVLSFKECVFSEAKMPQVRFYRADLSQCIFRNTQMNSACFISAYMPGCIMHGANLRESVLWAVQMQSAVLTDAILFRAVCRLINLEDAALSYLHASETDMASCSFERSDCSLVDLTKAVLTDCSFADAILTRAELTGAEFVRVNFENSVSDEMLSSYSSFFECNLKNALLTKSSFNYTVFRKCSFELANFENSMVTNVEFHGCDFRASNFGGTCFVNACFRDCENMKTDYFKNAVLINPIFEGKSKRYETEFKKKGLIIYD